jgi:hypothetical protein
MRTFKNLGTGFVLTTAVLALALAPRTGLWTPAQAAAAPTLTICGPLVSFAPATASGTGSITVGTGGPALTIAAGTTLTGVPTSTSNVCLFATLNSSGQIASGVLTVNPNTVTQVPLLLCGAVTAFTAATSSAAGTVTIGGATVPIATGATVSGVSMGATICLQPTLNASGQITAATVSSTPTFCGAVTAFTAATATAAGTITIAGATFAIAPGTTFTGATIATGANACIAGTFNAAGQFVAGAVTVPLAATPHYSAQQQQHNAAIARLESALQDEA